MLDSTFHFATLPVAIPILQAGKRSSNSFNDSLKVHIISKSQDFILTKSCMFQSLLCVRAPPTQAMVMRRNSEVNSTSSGEWPQDLILSSKLHSSLTKKSALKSQSWKRSWESQLFILFSFLFFFSKQVNTLLPRDRKWPASLASLKYF